MKLLTFCNKLIEYSFYALFFLVPLVFAPNTSELFELNKMWVTFGISVIVAFAWGTKILAQKKLHIQRTPFDIPLLLFGLSQLISTIFSLDQRVSWWGYYSRFNGGFLSTLSYIFLYYAYASNLSVKHTYKLLLVGLTSGVLVALWGFPSHFGKDPTCLLIRGTFDVSCWTDQFKPEARIFSTLGQPAWMASFLALLLPITLGISIFTFIQNSHANKKHNEKNQAEVHFPGFLTRPWMVVIAIVVSILFYLDLIYTNTKAGFLAFWIGYVIFWGAFFTAQQKNQQKKIIILAIGILDLLFMAYTVVASQYQLFWLVGIVGMSLVGLSIAGKYLKAYIGMCLALYILTFFTVSPFPEINNVFSFSNLTSHLTAAPATAPAKPETPAPTSGTVLEEGATESSEIRKIVWKGALDAWKDNPLFGTGVETFAFAYYKYRPAEHNMTSEWDYLYNKAHNEYLNYLATTGIFGLGTYLAFIAVFLWFTSKWLIFQRETETVSRYVYLLVLGLYAGYITILIANFFGFSVVITNLYLFLIPLFILHLTDMLPSRVLEKKFGEMRKDLSPYQWTGIVVLTLLCSYMLTSLIRFWYADTKYALGHNLDSVSEFDLAQPLLQTAVHIRPTEPVFTDELAINDASLAIALLKEKGKDAGTTASNLAQEAGELSDQATKEHPNNILVWKDRVRMLYLLAQANPSFYSQALEAILKAQELAPTDAKISYNVGVLYGQNGDMQKGIDVLKHTIVLKPDYQDAYFAMGLFYHELASKDNKVVNPDVEKQAVDTMHYILKTFDPKDKQVLDTLKSWGES